MAARERTLKGIFPAFCIPPSAVLAFHLSGVKSGKVEGQTFGYFASFFAVQSRD